MQVHYVCREKQTYLDGIVGNSHFWPSVCQGGHLNRNLFLHLDNSLDSLQTGNAKVGVGDVMVFSCSRISPQPACPSPASSDGGRTFAVMHIFMPATGAPGATLPFLLISAGKSSTQEKGSGIGNLPERGGAPRLDVVFFYFCQLLCRC